MVLLRVDKLIAKDLSIDAIVKVSDSLLKKVSHIAYENEIYVHMFSPDEFFLFLSKDQKSPTDFMPRLCWALTTAEKEVNEELQNHGDIEIGYKMAALQGPIYFLNVKNDIRASYFPYGRSLNTLRRFCEMINRYNVNNIVSEEIQTMGKQEFQFREIDKIILKGSNKPEKIFTMENRAQTV